MKRLVILFTIVVHLVLADAVVKEAAAGYLKGASAVPLVPGLFNLSYVENRGCAWGMFQGQVWPLAVFALLALGALIWKRRAVFGDGWLGKIAEPLLYAGIVGNLIDRVFRGYVIDMFDFYWRTSHFPCFNVADSLICVAVGLLLLCSFEKRTS